MWADASQKVSPCCGPGANRNETVEPVKKTLLLVTALLETAIGVVLLVSPSVPVSLLLGVARESPDGGTVARIAGAALISFGIACWQARHHDQNRALIVAMLAYNINVVAVLTHARLGLAVSGVAFWPAVGLHTVLAVWCIACFRSVDVTRQK